MDTPAPQKKGLSPFAWIGIGCGGIVILGLIAVAIFASLAAPKLKQFAQDMQKNPARTTANAMVTMSGGQFEMVAQDDNLKRYTVREKKSGQLTTVYWDEKTKSPQVVPGDFSAIPAAAATPAPAAP
jgi:hypothetical protein